MTAKEANEKANEVLNNSDIYFHLKRIEQSATQGNFKVEGILTTENQKKELEKLGYEVKRLVIVGRPPTESRECSIYW